MGVKSRCNQLCEDLNQLVPFNNLGELEWYAGCCFRGIGILVFLTISQQAFTENTAVRLGVSSGRNSPRSAGLKLEELDDNERVGNCQFRELVWCLM